MACAIALSTANDCADRTDGTFLPVPGDCTKYISCYRQEEHLLSCPEPYLYNRDNRMCDYTENVPWCLNPCHGQANGEIVASSQCDEYFICNNQNPFTRKCPAGFGFSIKEKRCVQLAESECAVRMNGV